jgi:flagellar protein FlgJ
MTEEVNNLLITAPLRISQRNFIDRADGGDKAVIRGKLKQASQELESLFVYQLLQVMRRTVPRSTLSGGERAGETFTCLMDQELSRSLSERGGIGLAEIIVRQLDSTASNPSSRGEEEVHSRGGSSEPAELVE